MHLEPWVWSTSCALNADWSARQMTLNGKLECVKLIQKSKSLGFCCKKVAEVSAQVGLSPNFVRDLVQVMINDGDTATRVKILSKDYSYAGLGLKVDSHTNTVYVSLLLAGDMSTASNQYWVLKK